MLFRGWGGIEIECNVFEGDSIVFEEDGVITCYEWGGSSSIVLSKETALQLAEELTKWAKGEVL